MVSKVRVLLVDDEPVFLHSMAKRLQLRGYEIGTAGSGMEALECLEREPYDVVVLDHRMPGMDGVETLQRLRVLQPSLPVILLSGYAYLSVAADAMNSGAVDYLLKPAPIEKLCERIGVALEKKRILQGLKHDSKP